MGWTHERALVASLSRSRTPDDPDLVGARHNLQAELLADRVRRLVDDAPELTPELRDRLVGLLHRGTP